MEEKMKAKIRIFALVCSVMLAFMLIVGCGNNADNNGGDNGGNQSTVVVPPVPVHKVISVNLQVNDVNVEGTYSVDISAGTLQFAASVLKDEGADGTVTYASSDTSVAMINSSGRTTLRSTGETVISASAGDKEHKIVLIVGDDYSTPSSHNITVIDGTSSVTSASEGAYVTVSPVAPPHKKFVEWKYTYTANGTEVEDIWLNGNIFTMPAAAVTVTAIYEDMLYTLNVIGATVTDDGSGGFEGEGEVIGNDKGGEAAEYDIVSYSFKYDTPITLEAMAAPDGKMFVGWDHGVKNNRVGELGDTEHTFGMPGETLTVWAQFSEKSGLDFYEPGDEGGSSSSQRVTTPFTDPDMQGMTGFTVNFSGSAGAVTESPENVKNSNLDTMAGGSQVLKAVFKNTHASLPVTVELYATQFGTIVTTGHVTVPANSVVEKYFTANLGFGGPWWGFALRENIGASSNETVTLHVGCQKAAAYPDGDKQFEIAGKAEYVNVGKSYGGKDWGNANERKIYNDKGMSHIKFNASVVKVNSYIYNSIENMPGYNANKPTKIYFRVINTNANPGAFKFNISTDTNQLNEEASVGSRSVTLGANGVELFAIELNRTSDAPLYFGIVKTAAESGSDKYGYNIIVQMLYNNAIGVQE